MSQFGYGRRTCQGQTVTEADLLVGIGSIAWLFNISKERDMPIECETELPPTPVSLPSEPFDAEMKEDFLNKQSALGRSLSFNEKVTISDEELLVGLSPDSAEDGETDLAPHMPCSFPPPTEEELSEKCMNGTNKEENEEKQTRKEDDPTLVYSTLLIAKPLPFKFDLSVRDRSRAEKVMGEFVQKKLEGEFLPSREYWGPNQGAGKELGWGKV